MQSRLSLNLLCRGRLRISILLPLPSAGIRYVPPCPRTRKLQSRNFPGVFQVSELRHTTGRVQHHWCCGKMFHILTYQSRIPSMLGWKQPDQCKLVHNLGLSCDTKNEFQIIIPMFLATFILIIVWLTVSNIRHTSEL